MTVPPRYLLNGEEAAHLSPFDRGLQFGDGVFETLAVMDGLAQDWHLHIRRLQRGCQRLALPAVVEQDLQSDAEQLCRGVDRGVLKIVCTRGSGTRGYRIPECVQPTRLLSLHPRPRFPESCYRPGITARLCEMRLSRNERLAGIKHLNRLEQVLARNEWSDTEIAEGLMLDTEGHLVEGTMSNLFLVTDTGLLTADLRFCGIEGIIRQRIIEDAQHSRCAVEIRTLELDDLLRAKEAFVCNSVIGIWPIQRLAGAFAWTASGLETARAIGRRLFGDGERH